MTVEDIKRDIETRLMSLGATQRELSALEDCIAVRVIDRVLERADIPDLMRANLTAALGELHEAIAIDWIGG